jgi:lipoyl(octanoyl) transferase
VAEEANRRVLNVRDLGLMPYEAALNVQETAVEARKAGEAPDLLLLVEHEPVYTLGRNSEDDNIVAGAEKLEEWGVDVVRTGRGGQVTYHGPGQLVGYPIISLQGRAGVAWYVNSLEETLIRTLANFGVDATRDPSNRGVWVGSEKIAAIGVRITRGVTMHGFSLNVDVNMNHYGGIIPCGIRGRGVTSLHLKTPDVSMDEVKETVIESFCKVFDYER